jgi:hypothetical protein
MTPEERRTKHAAYMRLWKKTHPDSGKDAVKKWKQEHPDRCLVHNHRWKSSHPKENKLSKKSWKENNKEKVAANAAIFRALKDGAITRPEVCELCEEKCSHGHHPDYSRPLTVVWLCRKCHKKIHRSEK